MYKFIIILISTNDVLHAYIYKYYIEISINKYIAATRVKQ